MKDKLDISVGKFTLESLTTGMYSDARIIYREYIQNAVDSLEIAVDEGLINPDEMRINIVADPISQSISITDNGAGVNSNQAVQVLVNIGDSTKRSSSSRGFRGIGRLGGMSYCQKLIFTTSAINESKATVISFDCVELRRLLSPGRDEKEDIVSLLNKITTVKTVKEKKNAHYFVVDLIGVDDTTGLLDDESVCTYIEEVAPLPYRKKPSFIWSKEIERYTNENGYCIEEFPIFFGSSNANLRPLYKLYRTRFKSNRSKRDSDEIENIILFSIQNGEELYALGWYAECSWLGTLSDLETAGLRIRKGNILIGDRSTLNLIFGSQSRFNAWVQGEIFVISDKLIPNARRDDFEKNEDYNILISELQTKVAQPIISKIRSASVKRNDSVGKTFREINSTINSTKQELIDGFNSRIDKEVAIRVLESARTALQKLPKILMQKGKKKKNR